MSLRIAVRELCEFTAKEGDLDLRFTPSPTAQQGREGHQLVAGRRGEGHEAEVSLSGEYQGLRVRGRADRFWFLVMTTRRRTGPASGTTFTYRILRRLMNLRLRASGRLPPEVFSKPSI